MADGRMVKRSIATCEQLERVSFVADYLFGRCIPFLDVEGRMDGTPGRVRALVCPLRRDITTEQVAAALRELHDVGLVIWYDTPAGRALAFPTFHAHNKIRRDKEAPSKVPPPPPNSGSTPGVVPDHSGHPRLEVEVERDCLTDCEMSSAPGVSLALRPAGPPAAVEIAGVVVGTLAGAARDLTAAVNRGVTDSAFGEQPVPIRADAQLEAAERVLAAGVDLPWAADWLYHRARRITNRRQIPRSLAFLATYLLEAWETKGARDDATRHAATFTPGADPTAREDHRALLGASAPLHGREHAGARARAKALRAAHLVNAATDRTGT